jgi:hypothetical protein
MTYLDDNHDVIEQKQKHGLIVSADDEAVYVRLSGSLEEFGLPPRLEAFQEAEEGEYRLRETGEVVIDPDLLCTWTIVPAPGT